MICQKCEGSGGIIVLEGIDYLTGNFKKNYYKCDDCNGTGKIKDKTENGMEEVK